MRSRKDRAHHRLMIAQDPEADRTLEVCATIDDAAERIERATDRLSETLAKIAAALSEVYESFQKTGQR